MVFLSQSGGRIALLLITTLILTGMGWAQMPASSEGSGSLWSQASLYRDEWGTPHIYADNIPALGYAFGYAQAEDHITDMLVAYRIANGRAAEVFGEYYATSDEFSLKLGHARLAAEAFPNLDPLTRDLCTGFAMGVNAWLSANPDKAPPWAEGVRPEDILALVHCYLMSQAPFDLLNAFHRESITPSGNAWAIGPTRSENGQPILVINPHALFAGPFRWYEAHLVCGDLDVAGATLFGVPVIMQGHNERLGWALSPNQPDFADIYLEAPGKVQNRAPNSVGGDPQSILENSLLDIALMSTAQKYFVQTPNGPEPRTVPVADTALGPIMAFENGKACLWKIGGYRDFGAIAQWMAMGRARTLQAFQEAIAMQQLPCFHILYADADGNIFYRYNVKTGGKETLKRAPGPPPPPGPNGESVPPPMVPIDWAHPVASEDPQFIWGPIIPPNNLPTLLNPESGYLQACGTPPWAVTDNSGISAEVIPPWFIKDFDSYRAQRVRKLLAMGKRSFRDCQSMLYDAVVPVASTAVPQLITLAKENAARLETLQPDLPMAIEILQRWNMSADIKSTGMTFFHAWWNALKEQDPVVFRSDPALYEAMTENSPRFQEVSLNAAAEAARMMRNNFDSVAVPWGKVHTLMRGKREVAMPGATSGDPVLVAADTRFEDKKWRADYGYGFAMVVAFGPTPTAVAMSPFGASEDPESPHYADQLDLLTSRRFRITRYLPEDVQRYASRARGCHLCLRSKGTEAAFFLDATTPVEARLTLFAQPPGPLPENNVPYSLYLQLEKVPKPTSLDVRMEIRVPEELCPQIALNKLAIYGVTHEGNKPENLQWERIDEQRMNLATRTLSAHDTKGPRMYVVLGPPDARTGHMLIPGETEVPPMKEFKPIDPNAPAGASSEPQHGFRITIQKSEADPTPVTIDMNTLELAQDPQKPENPPAGLTPSVNSSPSEGTQPPATNPLPEPGTPSTTEPAQETIIPGTKSSEPASPETLQPDISTQALPLVPTIKSETDKAHEPVGRNFNTNLINKPQVNKPQEASTKTQKNKTDKIDRKNKKEEKQPKETSQDAPGTSEHP